MAALLPVAAGSIMSAAPWYNSSVGAPLGSTSIIAVGAGDTRTDWQAHAVRGVHCHKGR